MQSDVMEESTYRVTLCKRNIFDSRDSLECENDCSLKFEVRVVRNEDKWGGREECGGGEHTTKAFFQSAAEPFSRPETSISIDSKIFLRLHSASLILWGWGGSKMTSKECCLARCDAIGSSPMITRADLDDEEGRR